MRHRYCFSGGSSDGINNVKFMSVSPLPYNLGSPYLFNTLIMEGTPEGYMSAGHVSLDLDFIFMVYYLYQSIYVFIDLRLCPLDIHILSKGQ